LAIFVEYLKKACSRRAQSPRGGRLQFVGW